MPTCWWGQKYLVNACLNVQYCLHWISHVLCDTLTTRITKSPIHALVISRIDYRNTMYRISNWLLLCLEIIQLSVVRVIFTY